MMTAGRYDTARRGALDAFEHALATSAHGGRLMLLTGDAGIGKTTLARALLDAGRRRGATVRWSACWPEGRTIPHGPWLSLLDGLGAAGQQAAARLRGAAEIDADAAVARASAYSAVIAGLETAASEHALVLVMDDLHWADEGTLSLLAAVASHLPGLPVVVVGTYRDVEVQPGSALTRLGAGPDRFSLTGLDEPAVADLLTDVTGGPDGAELAAAAMRLTSGNPFLVVQLGRLWASDQSAVSRGHLPAGAQGLLRERLASLDDDDRRVLAEAAVLGNPFRLTELEALHRSGAGADASTVTRALERAAGLRITERGAGTGVWAFVHDLFRQAARATLSDAEEQDVNDRAAQRLAELGAEASVVARHLLAAGPARRADAAAWSVRAGDAALAALAWEEAVAHYASALEVLPSTDDGRVRQDALFGLGRGHLILGESTAAAHAFEELAALGRRIGAPEVVARAALGFSVDLAGFEVRLFDQHQIDLLEEAAATLDAQEHRGVLASVLARLSVALSLTTTDDRRRELADRAVEIARGGDDPRVLARALAAHCDAIAGPDHVATREAEATAVIEAAERCGDGPLELLGRRLRFVARLEQGDRGGVEDDMAAFARRAEAVGSPVHSWYVPLWKAQLALNEGDVEAVDRLLADVETLGAKAGSTNAPMLATVMRLVMMWRIGDHARACQALDRMEETVPELVDYITAVGAFALTYARAGRPAQGFTLLDRLAAHGIDSVPRDAEWLPNLTSAVSAAVELRHPLLPELVARLEPYAHLVAFEGIGAGLHGVAGRFLAEAYLSLGRVDDAVRAARDALRVNRGIGGALTADAQRTLARCLEARGLATDAVEAAAMHAAADDAFRTYGLMRFVRAPVDTARDAAPPGAAHELIREGDVWRIAFRGDTVVVRHSKGLSDLALLLSRPGREVHVTEITQTVPGLVDPLHDPVLDPRAVGSYRTRLADLAEDIDEADAHHDLARAATLREEYDAIVAELSTAVGLGRRSRSLGSDPHERMRKAVTARIRDAIRRLGEQSPALGRHLTAGIRTGTFCSYQPETPVVWRCQP